MIYLKQQVCPPHWSVTPPMSVRHPFPLVRHPSHVCLSLVCHPSHVCPSPLPCLSVTPPMSVRHPSHVCPSPLPTGLSPLPCLSITTPMSVRHPSPLVCHPSHVCPSPLPTWNHHRHMQVFLQTTMTTPCSATKPWLSVGFQS